MLEGYAHSARSPPAFPDAPDAMDVASRMVILCLVGEYLGWRVRKYAVVQPIMPAPIQSVSTYHLNSKYM